MEAFTKYIRGIVAGLLNINKSLEKLAEQKGAETRIVFDLPKEFKGDKGDSPVLGTDYFTEADRKAMVESVKADLGKPIDSRKLKAELIDFIEEKNKNSLSISEKSSLSFQKSFDKKFGTFTVAQNKRYKELDATVDYLIKSVSQAEKDIVGLKKKSFASDLEDHKNILLVARALEKLKGDDRLSIKAIKGYIPGGGGGGSSSGTVVSVGGIATDGSSVTTAQIPFAQGIAVTSGLDGSNNATVIDLTVPLGATTFGIRFQGFYTDGMRFDGTYKTTDASISNAFAVLDGSVFTPTATLISGYSFGTAVTVTGSANATFFQGFFSNPTTRGTGQTYSGTIASLMAYEAQPLIRSGTVTNAYYYHGTNPALAGAGVITNLYGLYLEDISGATTTNLSIRTGLGKVSFGDDLIFSADNTDDIGASGATRPRTGYFGTNVSAPIHTSTVATGTAPFVVTSTTKVSNLNVDQVDGFDLNQNVTTTGTPSFVTVTSTQATGTAPFTVASTTKVTNLNADAVDGVNIASLTDTRLVRYNSTGTTLENATVTESSGALGSITTISMSGQLTSTLATGTAPFVVASTTVVANLNASTLTGKAIGTSGNVIPLMDGTNVWSGTQTFTDADFLLRNPANTFSATIKAGAQTGNRTFTFPVSASTTIMTEAGVETISGKKTFGVTRLAITGNTLGAIATFDYQDDSGVTTTFTFPDTPSGAAAILTDASISSVGLSGLLINTSGNIVFQGNGGGGITNLGGATNGTKIMGATDQKMAFYGSTPVIQQTDGAALTNNVTSGGTTNTIADFTSLTIYATDAAAIRNNIYQLARKIKIVDDALRTYGLLS